MAELVYPPVIVAIKTAFKAIGLRINITGAGNIPSTGGALMVINHIGYLDFALTGLAAVKRKRLVSFMAKKEIFGNKYAGPLMRGMHHISVDRESGSASFVAALKALKAGEIVGIFAEGTISRSFEIKELKTGAVRLAAASGVPIIPTIVWGSQRIWTKGRKRDFHRNNIPITIAIGEPFTVERSDAEAGEALLRTKLEHLLHTVQAEYPDSHAGQWWAPARLGGTAPTPEEVAREKDLKKNGNL
ncbi:1-acyl-sn-glycerol-3-phosphate acyltransferase [mine drainage metagenome]|uniref:1-acyl-sn-glycerol-3-phosphate acyltransferase n=1 Tax=mine drainage metagenome TaxID=410659 RepID=A0A1J5QFS0_9ZZZZ